MGETFAKLKSSILDSSIWGYSSDTRVVWITMLAMADSSGFVESTVPGLARRAVVSVEAVRKAIEIFLSPDPDSADPANDGRRIVAAPRGWVLLNYQKHRGVRDDLTRRSYQAGWKAGKNSVSRSEVDHKSTTVDHGRPESTHAEAEAEIRDQKSEREKSEEEQRGSPAAEPPRLGAQDAIRAELERHQVFAALDSRVVAGTIEGLRMAKGTPMQVVVDAIAECAAKSDGVGMKPHVLLSRLVGFVRTALTKPRRADAGAGAQSVDGKPKESGVAIFNRRNREAQRRALENPR